MAHSKRETMEVTERRSLVASLFLQGVPQWEIAKRLLGNVKAPAQTTISRDLKAIRAEWLKSAIRDFDGSKAKALEEIALVKREAWAAWERSKAPRGQGKNAKEREGDPRFLKVVADCVEKEAELLGHVTRPSEPTSPPGVVSFVIRPPIISPREDEGADAEAGADAGPEEPGGNLLPFHGPEAQSVPQPLSSDVEDEGEDQGDGEADDDEVWR